MDDYNRQKSSSSVQFGRLSPDRASLTNAFNCFQSIITFLISSMSRGTKRLVSVNICSVEGNSAYIFVSKVSPGILVVKKK